MPIFAAIVLTILPGSWIIYGLRLTGIPKVARFAMALALSPAVVGLQLVILEAIGIPFALSANALVLLNLPCVVLLVHRLRAEGETGDLRSWLSSVPLLGLLVGIPVLIWSLIPGLRTYEWETMLHTDVVYAIARDGVEVEETNLAGLAFAYGWIGHSYWSIIGWIGGWAPTWIYPFTNILWIIITFILSYQLGKTGIGLHKNTSLLGVALLFLGTNLPGMILLIVMGNTQWWERYFGDIRYSPFLSKFYAFDTMLWGMALLIAMALVYTIALQKKVTPLDSLTFALLVGLGLIYPVLFPAGLVFSGCFMLLITLRMTKHLPEYSRREIIRQGFAILSSVVVMWLYFQLITANREAATFALSGPWDIQFKATRFFTATGLFLAMATVPFIGFLRRWHGPALLLALSSLALSVAYVIIDLSQLEYKYVLAATICLAFLAAAVLDPLFQRHQRLGWVTMTILAVGLVVTNLVLVFQAGGHIPGNLDQGAALDESSFWITLNPSEPDSVWTKAIQENTPDNTVVIAQSPGMKLSVLVGRSMYFPSDIEGGQVPGYNLNQRYYLVEQRGYPEEVYERRLEVVEILYTASDETRIVEALHILKELQRPVAIHFSSPNIDSLGWLEMQDIGSSIYSDEHHIVWFIDDPSRLP